MATRENKTAIPEYTKNDKDKARLHSTAKKYRDSDKGKASNAKRSRAYQSTNKGKTALRRKYIKWRYGITQDDYVKMYDKQEGNCYTCGEHHDVLCVDHDHATGMVRGLLCNKCNLSLGAVNDNIDTLKNMIKYLRKKR